MTVMVDTPLSVVTPEATWEDITPERAAELLESNIDNRGLRRDAVAAYARDILDGRWMVSGETIKLDYTGRLIDGQHRLAAIVQADAVLPMLVVTGLDPAVQRVIDVNIRRTAGDALRFLGVERNIFEVASAARFAVAYERGFIKRYGTIRTTVSHAEIFAWVEAHPEIGELAAEARRLFHRLNTPPSPLTFAMWRLSQIDANDAQEFFTSTAEYATTGEGDPRATLLRVLNNTDSRLARRPATIVGVTFAAWNAWRDNQKLRTLPLVDAKGNAMLIEEPV
jgi:hypothetical protein